MKKSPFLDESRWIAKYQHCFVIKDGFPVSNEHTLVIPIREVSSLFDLTLEEYKECWEVVYKFRDKLSRKLNTNNFTIGVNDGVHAGQTVNHAHIHIIPRFEGDVEFPRGGIRGVIPSKKDY